MSIRNNKDLTLKEFARAITDDELRETAHRLGRRLSGDVGSYLEFAQEFEELNRIYSGAKTCDGLYDLVDETQEYIERECRRRWQ